MRGSSSTSAAAESGSKDGPGRDETKIEVKDSSKEADMKNEKEKEGTEVAKAASPANYGVGVHRMFSPGGWILLNKAV
jgi:hypothetical protein